MITLDGSHGEGGGQILRTALALSIITQQPFRIEKIRANREKPGLQRQHLTAVHAAAAISGAMLSDVALNARTLEFWPGPLQPGDHHFAIGTAGSSTLLLQTLLPALLTANAPSTLTLEGGTHNPMAPPLDFLEHAFLPLINNMGPQVHIALERPGFYPAGGGRWIATIQPAEKLAPIDLSTLGDFVSKRGLAAVAELPLSIAQREIRALARRLNWPAENFTTRQIDCASCAGNYVALFLQSQHLTEVVTAIGQRYVTAEAVAESAANEALRYLAAKVPVGEHLADQLLLPLALAAPQGEGRFRTLPLTPHAVTNIETIRAFLPDVSITTTAHPTGVDVLIRQAD